MPPTGRRSRLQPRGNVLSTSSRRREFFAEPVHRRDIRRAVLRGEDHSGRHRDLSRPGHGRADARAGCREKADPGPVRRRQRRRFHLRRQLSRCRRHARASDDIRIYLREEFCGTAHGGLATTPSTPYHPKSEGRRVEAQGLGVAGPNQSRSVLRGSCFHRSGGWRCEGASRIGRVASPLPLQLIPPCTKKVPQNAPLRTGTPRLMVDCSMYHP